MVIYVTAGYTQKWIQQDYLWNIPLQFLNRTVLKFFLWNLSRIARSKTSDLWSELSI